MVTIFGGIAGGLGLVFMGMRLLSERLKLLTNRRLRMSAARWTGNRWAGFAWGGVAGAVMQTMPALTFLLVGMLRSGILTVRRALPIVLGGNVGGSLLLLAVMIDIKLAVLYALGVSQIIVLITTEAGKARYRSMAEAVFGMGMMILGFLMLRESVAPLAEYAWFRDVLAWASGSLLFCLVSGALLSLLVQSSVAVMVAGIGMVAGGVLSVEQVLMLCYGVCLGSSLSVYLLTMSLTGRARQVAMYQVLHNCVANAIFVPLLYTELYLDVPLVRAAIFSSGLPLPQALAIACILVEVTTGAVQLALLGPTARLIERWWPTTDVEVLSKSRFIHDGALHDPAAALRLVDLEQRRLFEIHARYFDTVRRGVGLGRLRDAGRDVLERITEFLDSIGAQYPDRGVDVHVSLLTRQRLLFWLDERVLEFCAAAQALPRHSLLDRWRTGLVEGIDAALFVVQDLVMAEGRGSEPSAAELLGDRGELMHGIRNAYLRNASSLSTEERASVLRLTSIAEHIFLLLSKLASEYERCAAGAAPIAEPRRAVGRGGADPVTGRAAATDVVALEEPDVRQRFAPGLAGG